tara:strand:+ start:280 stop:642 length:363 start_codon:yes stop_codon:yes gene_type:complete
MTDQPDPALRQEFETIEDFCSGADYLNTGRDYQSLRVIHRRTREHEAGRARRTPKQFIDDIRAGRMRRGLELADAIARTGQGVTFDDNAPKTLLDLADNQGYADTMLNIYETRVKPLLER